MGPAFRAAITRCSRNRTDWPSEGSALPRQSDWVEREARRSDRHVAGHSTPRAVSSSWPVRARPGAASDWTVMERRVLVAIFLSFIVLYAYQAFIVKPAPKPPQTAGAPQAANRPA